MLSSNLWNEFCPPPDWKFCSAPAAPNWLAKGDATKLQRETLERDNWPHYSRVTDTPDLD